VTALAVWGPGWNEPLRLTGDTDPEVNPLLVISEMQNLATEVRDIERIIRIVRFRVNHLEYRSRWCKYPENAERARKRADAYRVWLFHLELMQT
jgi:hypothetical protein